MRKLRNALVVGGMAATVLIGTAGSGFAQDAGADASVAGAEGEGKWDYYSRTELRNVDLQVRDTKVDGHAVYVQLLTMAPNGSVTAYSKRYHRTGADTPGESWSGLRATNSAGIAAATVRVCVDDAGSDTCGRGPWREVNRD